LSLAIILTVSAKNPTPGVSMIKLLPVLYDSSQNTPR
jgi:hypothetical protein